jgi:4-hydroxy-4-methyl-2-oxoglutarate aldolase
MTDIQVAFHSYLEKLAGISTPHIADTMAKGLSKKLKHQTMDSAIKPLSSQMKICGPAYTVRCYPGATYAMEKAVAEAPVGTVLVCDGQGSDAGVMMGELMSTFAKYRGILGAVIDGAVRDIAEVLELNFPLFSRHITPRNGVFEQLGDVQQIISCGGVIVRPNDIICGDLNGVVIIPQEIIEQVVIGAAELEKWETEVKKLLLQGQTLEQAASKCVKPAVQII